MIILDKKCAIDYARKNCTRYTETVVTDIEMDVMRGDEKRDVLREIFDVSGYTVVDAFVFGTQDGETYYNYHAFCLFEVATARKFYIYGGYRKNDKYGLSLFAEETTSGRLNDFKFGEPFPNFIGKATKRKIEEWIRFRDREDEAKKAYITSANYMNRQFRKRVEKAFPNARMSILSDGWLRECEFVDGHVIFHYTAGDNGVFYRSTRVDISHLPSTDELLPQIEDND